MIPKIIHYCWFGNNPLPDSVKSYIATWKQKCPDYKIKEWNESNFNIYCSPYVKEAYKHKKWAFVADYVRLYVLVNYGGIYLDTDVEALKNLDPFLKYHGFCGFENTDRLSTAILGCEPHFGIFSEWLDSYKERHFVRDDGSLDNKPNVLLFTKLCKKYGLVMNNNLQNINGLEVFPKEYFSPKDYNSGRITQTTNSYTIHHFDESWKNEYEKAMHIREIRLIKILGYKVGYKISNIINLPFKLIYDVRQRGVRNEIIYIISKKHSQ